MGLRNELNLHAAFVQIPIGLESAHNGVIDIIENIAYYFEGNKGNNVISKAIPSELESSVNETRKELIESLADIDDEIGELFLNDTIPTPQQLRDAIRRQTIARKFVPVFMGSAYKNKGVQLLLDGVNAYLPSPVEVNNIALNVNEDEKEVQLICSPHAPLVALAFKLEESRFGQLTYIRIYQGTLRKGMNVLNISSGKRAKIPRLVRMHANEMEDVESASAGDVVAVFGVECASMDTFTDGQLNYSMMSMFVPNPVMSLAVRPKDMQQTANFSKAISKFTREDPTLKVHIDSKTNETIMSGMGELHLEIYLERLKREFKVECIAGNPSVRYKETIAGKSEFNYLHKKQSGGSGQYAKVIGYIEPLPEEKLKKGIDFEFANHVIGTNIPPEFIPSCEKGARAACEKGVLAGYPLSGVRVVVNDGQAHAVDSNDMAFQLAMQYALRQAVKSAKPTILEPVMKLEVTAPTEFQGTVIGGLNKRGGLILASDISEDGGSVVIQADVPLVQMFGYSTDIRSSTQGKGEFTMEYKEHLPVTRDRQEELIKKFQEKLAAEAEEKS
jgi:elongation factor G